MKKYFLEITAFFRVSVPLPDNTILLFAMATQSSEIAVDVPPFFRLYNDGSINRLQPSVFHPPSDDPHTAVRSKDVVIDSKTGVSVRIFVPRRCEPGQKLPLVMYTHGGAFCICSPTNPVYHNFVAQLVEKGNAVAVSVEYRLAPENPLPIAYDDSWATFQWVSGHASGRGSDSWLNEFADLQRVFLGGDSAGATIANDVAVRAGVEKFEGVRVSGIFLIHPFFGGKEEDRLYKILYPTSSARDDDHRLNPAGDPRIRHMEARRVLFLFAEKDFLRERGMAYCERLKKSEWRGEVETMESGGEGHCFHLSDQNCENALALMDRLIAFLNGS